MQDYVTIRREILENIAERLGKELHELVPWDDYDPIMVDENAFKLARNSNWSGD